MLKQQKIKIFYQQMNDAFVNYMHNNRFYQQIQNAGLGIDNLLPYLPKGVLPTTSNVEFDEKQKARMKARQSMGISNLQRPIDRSKSK